MNIKKLALLTFVFIGFALPVSARTLYGFTPFPYDATAEAVSRVQELLYNNSTVYALHFDDGVPWDEMINNNPLPKKMQDEWDSLVRSPINNRPVYLGLTPLGKDRQSLAPGRGEKDYLPLPQSLKNVPLDDDQVKNAYLNYARRAVKQFKPDYLNLGIEAGELAARNPEKWPQFANLYYYVSSELKKEYPQMKIGISFGLQSLRKPEVAQRVKALVEISDYIGLSFYPHASPFGERFGDPKLGDGAMAWREPLEWVRNYTNKPIAICETGALTQSVTMKSIDLTMTGDPETQTQYVRELAQFAKRDNYLFVVWYLAVDYDRLYERMGGDTKTNEVNLLWRNIGLWDSDVQPKPAFKEWKNALAGKVSSMPIGGIVTPPAGLKSNSIVVSFSDSRYPFKTSFGGKISFEQGTTTWSYKYKGADWIWANRNLGFQIPSNVKFMKLSTKSDREGPIFLQLEEKSGETFFIILDPKTTWSNLKIDVSSFAPDPAKRRDGVLQMDQVNKILLADPSGRDGAKGKRTVQFSNWSFE